MNVNRVVDNLEDEEADRLLTKLLERRSPAELISARDARTGLASISEYAEGAASRIRDWGLVQGLTTGYSAVDQMTKGLVDGELIIVSGFTSHGKTQLVTNMAYKIASQGHPVLFATLEQTHVEITSRLMKIAEPGGIEDLPILFQKEQSLDYRDISNLIKNAKNEGAKLVIIDHLQMLVRSIEHQTQEASKVVQELKKAALHHQIPIIMISHTRKVNDKIDGKRRAPELEDLKDTSAIAQDADIVLFVYRNLEDEEANNDEVIVSISKNRNRGIFRDSRKHIFKSTGVRLTQSHQ